MSFRLFAESLAARALPLFDAPSCDSDYGSTANERAVSFCSPKISKVTYDALR